MTGTAELLHLFISPGHNFFGHHGQAAGTHPIYDVPAIECVAQRGIQGDRFFNYKADYKGQITFVAIETFEALCATLKIHDKSPAALRRNVVTRGLDLEGLIGKEFSLQGIRFLGTESCKPCYWMDHAFGPGAEAAMAGRGGLRARILTSGRLCAPAPANLCVLSNPTLAEVVP